MKHYFATITTYDDEHYETIIKANSEEEAIKIIHNKFKDKTHVSHLKELKHYIECI